MKEDGNGPVKGNGINRGDIEKENQCRLLFLLRCAVYGPLPSSVVSRLMRLVDLYFLQEYLLGGTQCTRLSGCATDPSLSLSALLNLLFPFSTNKRDVGAARSRRRREGICLAFRCVNTRASCSLVSARAKQRKYGRRQEQPREIYVEPEQISSLY